MRLSLRPYQIDALEQIRNFYRNKDKKVLLWLATGGGKCHGYGTPIIMFSGEIKRVEDIQIGDLLMGPDSKPRLVISLARGTEQMYKIIPVKGDEWICNESHILSLVETQSGNIINISVRDWLQKNKHFKHTHKLYKVPVEFCDKNIDFDPYILGIYLAEGSKDHPQITNPDFEILDYLHDWAFKNDLLIRDEEGQGCREYNFKSKVMGWYKNHCDKLRKYCTSHESRWIPKEYLFNSRKIRLEVLAGLLDGDGYYHHGSYEIVTKHIKLRDDIKFLAGSLGYAVYFSEKIVKGKSYWRLGISGNLIDIPCKIERKKPKNRLQKKNVLRNGFTIEPTTVGDYYGFEITGDNLYLLGDFTVTHNTLIFSQVLKGVHEKGKKAIMVVRGKSLVAQASLRLDREGVPHGVIQANHARNRPNEPIQICSIDTLARRRITPEADLLVIDEAHLASSESFKWLVSHYPDAYFLPVTATPFVKHGLRHIADQVVHTITMRELISQGFLVPPKYFVPSRIDLSSVKIDRRTNDYATASLEEAMSRANIFGDLVKAYREKAFGRSAICFAVSIEHSLALRDNFRAYGIRAEHVEANTSQEERNACIKLLEDGGLDIICNVGILTTGVDIPSLGCVILARPTKSYNLYIQMLGRGTRIFEGKENFIVLDHVNNIEEHGFIENEAEIDLDGKKPREIKERILICGNCLYAFSPNDGYECPECGFDNGPKEREAVRRKTEEDEAYRMKEIHAIEMDQIQQFIEKKIGQARMNRYKAGWVFYKVQEKYGKRIATKNWAKIKQKLIHEDS